MSKSMTWANTRPITRPEQSGSEGRTVLLLSDIPDGLEDISEGLDDTSTLLAQSTGSTRADAEGEDVRVEGFGDKLVELLVGGHLACMHPSNVSQQELNFEGRHGRRGRDEPALRAAMASAAEKAVFLAASTVALEGVANCGRRGVVSEDMMLL
jgi:hypothetical protein